MSFWLLGLMGLLLLHYCIHCGVQWLNLRSLSTAVPKAVQDTIDASTYARSQAYTTSRTRLDITTASLDLGVWLLLLGSGVLGDLDTWIGAAGWGETVSGLVFFAALGLGLYLVHLPLHIYATFRIEQRHGFNTTTAGVFWADQLKTLVLTALLAGVLLSAVLLFFQAFPRTGWLWAWLSISLVLLLLQVVTPRWILPLFNRFTPLEEGHLRQQLTDLAHTAGFRLASIAVMDGSKRSTKANAFFAGLGKTKRIALFDTLVQTLTPREVAAVLAHEIGHNVLGHIPRLIGGTVLKIGFFLALFALLKDHQGLIQGAGFAEPSLHAGLTVFFLILTPVGLLLGAWHNTRARRYEFEADRYAARLTEAPQDLISALKRLAAHNMANLTPHPWHVALYASHPPLLKRLEALNQEAGDHV